MDFAYWLDRAEKMPFLMADLRVATTDTESELGVDALRRLEKAARSLVSGAYVDPDKRLREIGVSTIRIGTLAFSEMVLVLEELLQIADYYRAPLTFDGGSEHGT